MESLNIDYTGWTRGRDAPATAGGTPALRVHQRYSVFFSAWLVGSFPGRYFSARAGTNSFRTMAESSAPMPGDVTREGGILAGGWIFLGLSLPSILTSSH